MFVFDIAHAVVTKIGKNKLSCYLFFLSFNSPIWSTKRFYTIYWSLVATINSRQDSQKCTDIASICLLNKIHCSTSGVTVRPNLIQNIGKFSQSTLNPFDVELKSRFRTILDKWTYSMKFPCHQRASRYSQVNWQQKDIEERSHCCLCHITNWVTFLNRSFRFEKLLSISSFSIGICSWYIISFVNRWHKSYKILKKKKKLL